VTGAIRSLLLDVEGTTTPISFVSGTLFPFARARLADFLAHAWNTADVSEDIARLRAERAAEADPAAPAWNAEDERSSALAYLIWLMDRDRKSTALKSLQGKIWQDGFESGALVAPVYPDVPRALARWRDEGRDVSIYSSGSVLAQRLLFSHTDAGDLTGFFRAYFDTKTGPKREAASYAVIARELGRAPGEVRFVSDVTEELDAARAAGMETALCIRPGAASPSGATHRAIGSFDEI
jgi:enolase-phosphatase E1